MAKWESEADLAREVIGWLQQWGYTIYQEVGDLDILAVLDGKHTKVLWGIECKRHFNFKVISQAQSWLAYTHRTSVAVPRRRYDARVGEIACRTLGIGIIQSEPGDIREALAPAFRRKTIPRLLDEVRDFHVDRCVAGSPSGSGRWSPYKQTCSELRRYLTKHPGASMKESIDNIRHHYASQKTARACLCKWLQLGKVPGVERRGRGLFLTDGDTDD